MGFIYFHLENPHHLLIYGVHSFLTHIFMLWYMMPASFVGQGTIPYSNYPILKFSLKHHTILEHILCIFTAKFFIKKKYV